MAVACTRTSASPGRGAGIGASSKKTPVGPLRSWRRTAFIRPVGQPPPRAVLFLEGKDALPVVLHADGHPSLLLRLVVQRLGEGANLGIRQPLRGAVLVLPFPVIVQ